MTTIGERMKTLIREAIPERGRFKALEEVTDIKEKHWKNWWYGQQRPYELMIQSIARLWPEYSLWLIAGIDDPETGQLSAESVKPSHEKRTYAGRYLRRKVEFDELFRQTMQTSLVKEEEQQGDAVTDETVKKTVDIFFRMLAEMTEKEIPIDPNNVDVEEWLRQAMTEDKLLKKLAKERREELRNADRKSA